VLNTDHYQQTRTDFADSGAIHANARTPHPLNHSSHTEFVTGMLGAMAFLALTTFFNMWQPQFDDVDDHRMTWVHTWDMRVYFPSAKYFDELGFDGLYLASVAAYLEDAPGATEERVAGVEIRDLRNYEMTTVSNVVVRVRTSPLPDAASERALAATLSGRSTIVTTSSLPNAK
jgi:hypothetical protein